jgi:protein SCO1/2
MLTRAIPYLLAVVLISALLTIPLSSRAEVPKRFQRSVEHYSVPDVVLVNQDRQKVRLPELLSADKPVMLDFIYGTCTTVCPVLSAGFSNLQKKLGPAAEDLQLVSVTIDPQHDTPEIMAEYLQRYRRKPGWDFLTGSSEDIDKVMHAFNAYVPNKMNHYPLTLMRGPGKQEWIRIYGLIGTADLMDEYRKLGAK